MEKQRISDMTPTDFQGAARQWLGYLTGKLGFDYALEAQVRIGPDRIDVWLYAQDKFQEAGRYENRVGQLCSSQSFAMDSDWGEACKQVWEKLQNAMPRDEREMRHGLRLMGSFLDDAPTYTSAVGKMLAERIRALRDEVTGNLLEFSRARNAAEPAEQS